MARHDVTRLTQWTAKVFASRGMPMADAEEAAALLVRSDLRGYTTHGMARVVSYCARLDSGEFNARPRLREQRFPGGIVYDADGAMGHVALPRALRLGLEALKETATVLVAIRECGHLGALGIHALPAAEAGAFCLVGQRVPPILALPGFSKAAIGHNPIAFGCPMPGAAPIVFDIACSVAARGHILLAAREGKPIPEGWAIDADGAPTTDAKRALEGSLVPMGGHKGIGIAMMVEVLAGALAATAASLDPSRNRLSEGGASSRQGAFLWLAKPAAFDLDGGQADYMRHWTDLYLSAAQGTARLPGTRGDALEREGRARGVEVKPAIEKELAALGARLDLPFPG